MSIWWEKVPNASNIINDVSRNLAEGVSVILSLSEDAPEQDVLGNKILERLSECNRCFTEINGDEESDPADYFFGKEEYIDYSDSAQYRPVPGSTRASFLASCGNAGMNNYMIYIRVKKNINSWLKFVSDYCDSSKTEGRHCVFLLQIIGEDRKVVPNRRMACISWYDYITEYDCVVYSMLCASELKADKVMKVYLADIASGISNGRIDLCRELMCYGMQLAKSTVEIVEKAVNACMSEPISVETINKVVWMAQIKLLFPIIEDYRIDFIRRHYADIELHIRQDKEFSKCEAPEDVELGALWFYINSGNLMVTRDEKRKTEFYRYVRNKLAHWKQLSFEEIVQATDAANATIA